MKTRFYILLATVLCLAACNKDKEELHHKRDIVYTVAEETTTVHLTTEAEWQQLLDHFCDYAEGGSSVTFRNAKSANKSATKETVTYSTTDREEMKRWMAQMEDEGMTVTVTYDPATGTYSGTAYATAPQYRDCYTGVIVAANYPINDGTWPRKRLALKVNADTIMFITRDGYSFDERLYLGGVCYYEGDTVTICGTTQLLMGDNGEVVIILAIDERALPPLGSGIATYVSEGYEFPGSNIDMIVTIDSLHRTVYINHIHYWAADVYSGVPRGVYYNVGNKNGRLIVALMNSEEDTLFIERQNDNKLRIWYRYTWENINRIPNFPYGCLLVPAPEGTQTWYSEQLDGVIMHILPGTVDAQPPIHRAQICALWWNSNCSHPFKPRLNYDHNGGGFCEIHRTPSINSDYDWGATLHYSYETHTDFYIADSLALSGHNLDNDDFSPLTIHVLNQNPCYSEFVFHRIN